MKSEWRMMKARLSLRGGTTKQSKKIGQIMRLFHPPVGGFAMTGVLVSLRELKCLGGIL